MDIVFGERDWRRALLAASATTAGLLLPSAASAQSDEWFLGETYIRQLQGQKTEPQVSGPEHAIYSNASSSRQVPIAQLSSLLKTCRAASFSTTEAGYPPGVATTQNFECLKPGAPAKAVSVTVVVRFRIKSVATVNVLLGGQVYWPGPAPSGPAWKQWDQELYGRYRDKVASFVSGLASGKPVGRPLPIKLYTDTERGTVISVGQLQTVLRGCELAGTVAAAVRSDPSDAPREGVKTYVKCDKASSAPDDLTLYSTFSDGEIDGMLVAASHNYRLSWPPVAAVRK